MQIVEAISDARASDTSGRLSYALTAGLQYVLHDPEADAGARDGALKPIKMLDEVLPRYAGQPLTAERLMLPHIGGLGDGLVLSACLKSLKDQYPGCSIDIPCPKVHHSLLKMIDADLAITPYPPPASELKHYSFFMSLEDVDAYADDRSTSNIQIFGRCLHTLCASEAIKLKVPSSLLTEWDIGGAERPRIGIALAKPGNMRSYPLDLTLELAKSLLERDCVVCLFGSDKEIEAELPHAPPKLLNFIGQTPSTESLAALIAQMDAMICCDSLFMHIAGALRILTLAIFSSSARTAAGGYPTIKLATASVPCSPCGAVAELCPLGHAECIVHRHPDLDPHRLAQLAIVLLEDSRGSKSATGQSGDYALQ